MSAAPRASRRSRSKPIRKYDATAVRSKKTNSRMRSRALASPTIAPMNSTIHGQKRRASRGGPVAVVEVARQVGGAVDEHDAADPGRQQRVERAEPVEGEVQPQPERRRPRQIDRPAAAARPGEDTEADDRKRDGEVRKPPGMPTRDRAEACPSGPMMSHVSICGAPPPLRLSCPE